MRDPRAVERGRLLRKGMTPPERKLWYRLNNRQQGGIKFRRQAPLGPFIADFLSLVIELDGETHADPAAAARDDRRTRFFEERGFRVIRFFNREVGEDLDNVVERVRAACGLAPSGTD